MEVAHLSLCTVSAPHSHFGTKLTGNNARGIVSVRMQAATSSSSDVLEIDKPETIKYDPVVSVVRKLIRIKPLYELLKIGAKSVMIRTAEKNGIAWKQIVENLKASPVFAEKEKVENDDIIYPEYYKKPFHTYETGNLSWEAAFEVEPATMSLWMRTFKDSKSWEEAAERGRGAWVNTLHNHHLKFSNGLPVEEILDIGCSTANSSRYLGNFYSTAQVTGLDLSPYFLAVAQYVENQECLPSISKRKTIQFLHANAESTGLPPKAFDVITIAYVIHECPRSASKNIFKEAYRLLKPGGTIAITDHWPKSKVVQSLHPAIRAMMEVTEPWIADFYRLDLEAELQGCGFEHVTFNLTTPRHFTYTATVPVEN